MTRGFVNATYVAVTRRVRFVHASATATGPLGATKSDTLLQVGGWRHGIRGPAGATKPAAVASPTMVDDAEQTDVKQSIRMTADRLLASLSDEAAERKSRAGIVIPATANVDRRLVWAEVIAVGPTVRNVEEGDRVLFAPDAGYEVEIRGDEYLILRERDVHAVASTGREGQSGLYL